VLELDRDVHFPQIIALNKKMDELIQVGLAKTTSVNQNTGVTQSLDRAQAFQLMAAERRELELDYFDLARPLLEAPDAKPGASEEQPVAMIGRFEWVPSSPRSRGKLGRFSALKSARGDREHGREDQGKRPAPRRVSPLFIKDDWGRLS